MKMSKSGKAAAAKAVEPASAPSAPKSLFQAGADSPLINTTTPNRLSALSSVAASPGALSVLPQLPLSNTVMRDVTASAGLHQQDALLKLLSEQRGRDLLAMAGSTGTAMTAAVAAPAAAFPAAAASTSTGQASFQANGLQRLLMQQRVREGEQQLLRLARQELAEQQQRNESALQMAILALRTRRDQPPR